MKVIEFECTLAEETGKIRYLGMNKGSPDGFLSPSPIDEEQYAKTFLQAAKSLRSKLNKLIKEAEAVHDPGR